MAVMAFGAPSLARKRRPDIYNRCGLSNATFKVNESEDPRAHRLPISITRESDVLIKFFLFAIRMVQSIFTAAIL